MRICFGMQRLAALLMIPLWLAGCSGAPAVKAPAGAAPSPTEYQIGAGDQLRITIFNQPNLSGDFTVDGAGLFPFPLIGLIQASSKTAKEIAHAIAEQLSQGGYLVKPNVAVQVILFRPYYILGEVTAPGVYPYSVNMTVMKAVAAARGFTYRANTRRVFIQRAGQSTEQLYELTPAVTVSPGDTVRIPERLF
jgi:polysaccharide export outer membrane protein